MACNYDEIATDAGDCEYAAEFYDCDGNCLNDTDADGICDEFEVEGVRTRWRAITMSLRRRR